MKFIIFFSFFVGAISSPLNANNPAHFLYPLENDNGFVKASIGEKGGRILKQSEISEVKFYLFTLDNPDTPHELIPGVDETLDSSHFRPNVDTKLIAHGFTGAGLSGPGLRLKNEYMAQQKDVNIIIIDWEKFALPPWYDTAAANAEPVGHYAGSLILYLTFTRNMISLSNVHFIGHSLGSHVAGFGGAWMSEVYQPIARITGLDPALPLFFYANESYRLDTSDAVFVDVIHTAGGSLFASPPGLAFTDPLGHIDFYPNGGVPIQPGCGIDFAGTCSHARAWEFFTESIGNPNGFLSCKCTDWEEYDEGNCGGCPEPHSLGEYTDTSHRYTGLYFCHTNSEAPFAQN